MKVRLKKEIVSLGQGHDVNKFRGKLIGQKIGIILFLIRIQK